MNATQNPVFIKTGLATIATATGVVPLDVPSIVGAKSSAAAIEFDINGTVESIAHAQTLTAGQTTLVGARSPATLTWDGLISELIVTQPAMTTTERQKVEGYLAHKYGKVASLPATHPYKKFPPISYAPDWLYNTDVPTWHQPRIYGPTIPLATPGLTTVMNAPLQLAINSKGVIYVADFGNNQLLVLNGDGTYNIRLTGTTSITGVCIGPDDSVYITYVVAGASTLRKYNPRFVLQWSVGSFVATFRHLATDGTNIYVTTGSNIVYKFLASTGAPGTPANWGAAGAGNGQFNSPWGIAYNRSDGLIYVVDSVNARIQVFTTAGVYQRQFSISPYNASRGLAVDNIGNLIIATGTDDYARIVTKEGVFINQSIIGDAIQSAFVTPDDSVWVLNGNPAVVAQWQKTSPRYSSIYAWTVEVTDELGGISGTAYGGRQLESEAPDGTTDFIIENTGLVT